MRGFIFLLCIFAAGCTSPQRSEQERQEGQARVEAYKKDLEDQLGITRARQRQAACQTLPMPAIGMTRSQVLSSCWGQPDHAAESVTAEGKMSVWSYPEGYVYLTNETVTKIVTAR